MWREIINRIVTSPRSIVFNAIAAALLFSLLFGLLVSPQWSGKYLTAALMGATLAALIGNFEHIESFKASSSGIEAKTREVVRRAETTLQELQNLAAMMGPLLIDLIVGGGRWGGRGTPADKDAQKNKFSKYCAMLASLRHASTRSH
ncbi:MAG: hypothetical protein FJ311_02840 [Rhodospirillales bacterium]|nr:hypothetical protein [Rhodospirillales bacterium]